MNRLLVPGAVTAIATAVTLTLPPSAGALGSSAHARSATALDRCPGTAPLCRDRHAVETLAKGTRLKASCSTKGRGGTWFYVRASDGKTGFVSASKVSRAGSVAACSHNHAVTAALWATRPDVWNQTKPTSAMAAELESDYGSAYNFGHTNDWSGDSRAFGALAYLANGKRYKLPLTNPIDTYNAYRSEGKVHTRGVPPIGALVFWHHVSYGYEYGLLGVSLGDRRAVTAPGFDDSSLPIAMQGTKANIGWVLPY